MPLPQDKSEKYKRWRSLVNMSYGELKKFYDSPEGKKAGLSSSEAKSQGIGSGRESARWIMKMKTTKPEKWTEKMWDWAGRQISFISRMSGNSGPIRDEKGQLTRKGLSLKIWGHNPEKSKLFEDGGYLSSIQQSMTNLKKNGIVLNDGNVTVICYNTGNQSRSLSLYNQSLIYKVLSNIDKNIASKIIVKLNHGIHDEFDENKIDRYKKSEYLIIMNQNDVVYDSRNTDTNFKEDGGEVNNIYTHTTYYVTAHTDRSSDILYSGDDIKWAEIKFEGADISDVNPVTGGMITFEKKENKYKFVYELNENESVKDFPISDYYDDSEVYELVDEGELEIIEERQIDPANKASDELLHDVQRHYQKIYGRYKYNTIYVHDDDEDETYLGCFQLRIADHSENVANIDRFGDCKFYISVVIADQNQTSGKFLQSVYERKSNEIEIEFTSEDSFEEIISDIDEKIKEVINVIKSKEYKTGGGVPAQLKPHKEPEQIAKEKNVPLSYVNQQIEKGIKVESEHTNSPELQRSIALHHIDEMVDYYEKLEKMENQKYEKGGHINPDAKPVKDYFAHSSGNAGGVLVGKRHSEGGIKAINKSTGQPLEMEGGEVVITRKAVSDNSKREFEGEMLTNREILSRINQSGGGVAIFSEGGSIIGKTCSCSGKSYKYGGKTMTDFDIMKDLSNYDNQMYYSTLESNSYEKGGKLDTDNLNPTEKYVLSQICTGSRKKCSLKRGKVNDIKSLEKSGIVYTIPSKNTSDCVEVYLTPHGIDMVSEIDIESMAKGGLTIEDCGCGKKHYKLGGETPKREGDYQYFKGVDADYKNQYEINKAIEELINSVPGEEMTAKEKNFISYFSGYGGLEKYGAKGKGLLYEYFTPSVIAKKMWGLAYKYGFSGGLVLEPSCGIGEFIKYAPDQKLVTGYEINPVSAKICKILYPDATILPNYFETIFIKNNDTIRGNTKNLRKYSLIIGNPPYGSMGGIYSGMGEKSYTKANNYIEYFISRGLDILEKDGLLIYIIGTEVAAGGTPFLKQPMTEVKKIISQKSVLVDAYRLPNGVFETTDVLTDIIVLRKK